MKLNRILARQLKRLSLTEDQPPNLEQWHKILEYFSNTLKQNEEDRYLLERSLAISSKEMKERTEREREMSLQLAQASKLTALGTLASGVAHELNNPLGAVLGYADILAESPSLTEEERGLARRIAALVDRMAGTIRHLLKLSRKPSASDSMGVSLLEIIKDSLELFETQMAYENIHVHLALPAEPIIVDGGHGRLASVVQNLISNARDEFNRPGRTPVPGATIAIDLDPLRSTTETICLRVRDNAGGIPPEILSRIFDPFFTTKTVGKGTGLGLSLTKRILEEVGGSIAVESKDGETAFYVTLRRTKKLDTNVTSIRTAAQEFPRLDVYKKRVLIVDDEADIVAILRHKLKNIFEIVSTTSPKHALDLIRTEKFDYVLSDLKMPEISGDDLLRQAGQIAPDMGLVLISGHAAASREDLLRKVQHDFVMIEKPLPDQDAFVRLILSSARRHSQQAA
ncbi:MAG: ATP-binding protein [Bdellovibrionales bacterium]